MVDGRALTASAKNPPKSKARKNGGEGEPKTSSKAPVPQITVVSRSATGPDFMCVGMQKAGTRWLYDQVQAHEDFWMPASKELHYFDKKFPDRGASAVARRFFENPHRVRRKRQRRGNSPIDERNVDFFEQIVNFNAPEGDLDAYANLFRAKGDKITGDITPAYCSLDDWTIKQISLKFPELRVCLLLREPVDRLWSQWRMYKEKQEIDVADNETALFKEFTALHGVLSRSYPTRIVRKWRRAFGDRLRYFFLDDIAARPAETRAELLTFLGGDPSKPSEVGSDFNRKAKAPSSVRSDEIKVIMRGLFEVERANCAEMLGGSAKKWLDKAW